MRILVYSTDDIVPPIGGAEGALRDIILRNKDIYFDIISSNFKNRSRFESFDNLNIYRIGNKFRGFTKYYLAFMGHRLGLKLMKTHKYDLIWAMMASYGAYPASRLSSLTGIPYLLTLQEGDPLDRFESKARVLPFLKNIFKKATSVQVISTFLANWAIRMGYKGDYLEVVPNGVDLKVFLKDINDIDIKSTRKKFGFGDNRIILITTSRLVEKNGVEYVIKALPNLEEKFVFVVIGFGPLENKLRKLAKDLNVDHRVVFLGHKKYEELPLYLKACDIFIRPSLTEGFGNSFIEAMSVKIPVVATLVGGITDFLIDDVTGFVVRPKNSKSIANKIKYISNLDKNHLQNILNTSYEMVITKYDWDIIAKKMRYIFENIAKK